MVLLVSGMVIQQSNPVQVVAEIVQTTPDGNVGTSTDCPQSKTQTKFYNNVRKESIHIS